MVQKSLLTFAVLASATFAIANVEIPIEGHVFGPINGQGTWEGPGTVSPEHSPRLGSTQSVKFSYEGSSMRSFAHFRLVPSPERLKQNGIYFWHLDFMGPDDQSIEDGGFCWLRQQLLGEASTSLVRHSAAAGVGLLRLEEPFNGILPLSVQFNVESQTVSLSAYPEKMSAHRWYTITRILDLKGKRMQGIIVRDAGSGEIKSTIHVSDLFYPILGFHDEIVGRSNVIDRIRFGHDNYPGLQDYYYDNIQFLKAKRISGLFQLNPSGAPAKFLGDPELLRGTLVAFRADGGAPIKMPFNPAIDNLNERIEFATALMPGTYDAYIQVEGFLSKRLGRLNITDTDEDLEIGELVLNSGDIDGDDAISTDDYLSLNRNFDLDPGDSNFNPRADLDGDGFVTTDDYLIFNFNFDQIGALREDGRIG